MDALKEQIQQHNRDGSSEIGLCRERSLHSEYAIFLPGLMVTCCPRHSIRFIAKITSWTKGDSNLISEQVPISLFPRNWGSAKKENSAFY